MNYFERFQVKMETAGGSLRNEHISDSKHLIGLTFEDDASYALNVYRWELGDTTDDYQKKRSVKIRFYNRKYSSASGVTIEFQTPYEEKIVVGDILYLADENVFYLCEEVFDIDSIHWQGKFTLCNWILKWQNPVSGEILAYPCHAVNATQYNSGEQSNKLFTIGSSQHMITLPYDENTVVLSTPQRFYLDRNTENPTVYIVTQNDTVSGYFGEKGLIRITVFEHTEVHDADRPDLGICDYKDPSEFSHDTAEGDTDTAQAVISYDTTIIKSGGDKQKFVGSFYDAAGNELTLDCVWEIICDFENELEVSRSDHQIEIGIDNDRYIDEDFRLILSDTDHLYTSELIITIESLL